MTQVTASQGKGRVLPTTQAEADQLRQRLARLEAENAALKAKSAAKITCKVSEKGALSLYGLQRWPVTLYREQWTVLFQHRDMIEKFIRDNASKLATKSE